MEYVETGKTSDEIGLSRVFFSFEDGLTFAPLSHLYPRFGSSTTISRRPECLYR